MAKPSKRIPRAKKTRKLVTTIEQAADVYGGVAAMNTAFGIPSRKPLVEKDSVRDWIKRGSVPRGHQLGLYLGLQRRGYEMSPKLCGIESWDTVPGITEDYMHAIGVKKAKRTHAKRGA